MLLSPWCVNVLGVYSNRGEAAWGLGDSGRDCCACVEQKALMTEILQKAGEGGVKSDTVEERADMELRSPSLLS